MPRGHEGDRPAAGRDVGVATVELQLIRHTANTRACTTGEVHAPDRPAVAGEKDPATIGRERRVLLAAAP